MTDTYIFFFIEANWLSYTHIYNFFLYSFLLWFIPGDWIQFPVLYSRTLLFIHPIYTSLHLLIPDSHSVPPPALSPLATTSLLAMSVLTPFVLILFSSITGVMTILTLQQFWRPGKFTASTLCWMWRSPLSFIMVFASQSSLPLTPIPDKVQLIDWWSHLFRPAIWESGPRPIPEGSMTIYLLYLYVTLNTGHAQ